VHLSQKKLHIVIIGFSYCIIQIGEKKNSFFIQKQVKTRFRFYNLKIPRNIFVKHKGLNMFLVPKICQLFVLVPPLK